MDGLCGWGWSIFKSERSNWKSDNKFSFIVQMAPVSVNGLGVREATFSYYFARLGLPLESALALSFLGAVLLMIFSLSGAAAYIARQRAR